MDEKCQKKVNHSANQSHTGFITGSIPVFTPVSPRKIFPVFKKDYSWKILIKFLDIWQLKYFLKNIKRIILSFHARISEIKNLNQNIILIVDIGLQSPFSGNFIMKNLDLGRGNDMQPEIESKKIGHWS